jgi:hypothetical protein
VGIPVIDLMATTSFAKAHPYWTAFEIVLLVALAWFVVWFSRKFPRHTGKLWLGMFAVYLAVAVTMLWATFKTEPSQLAQLMDAAHQGQFQQALEKAQAENKTSQNSSAN